MQALILAAGTGSRLGKYTEENTKCMLEVNGKTLIEQALDKLDKVNITDLVLVVGYKKENLMNFLGTKYKNINIRYIENNIYDSTNNIYSLYLAREELIKDDTILLESDLIFDEEILQRLISDERKSLAVVDKYEAWMDGTSVTLNENDEILNFFGKKSFNFFDVDKYYKTVNIYKFSKEFSARTYMPFLQAYVTAKGDNEYYESVLNVLTILDEHELRAMRLSGEKWYEIDDVQDKSNAEIIFAKNNSEKLKLLQARYGGYWRFPGLKDFCYLVNPYFPPEKMVKEMKAYFTDLLTQYPSGQETQRLLAGKMFGLEPEDIIVGNGAAEFIKVLKDVLPGTFGIMTPTFNEYINAVGEDRVVSKVATFDYGVNEVKQLIDLTDNTILINPDNPSGNTIDYDDIIELLNYAKIKNKKIIVDESFIDFADNGDNMTILKDEIIHEFDNLVIIKSISKSYGVPGLRLGVLASANKKIMEAVKDNISIWNINSFGEFFLQGYGKYKKDYKVSCEKIRNERNRFFNELSKIPELKVYKSGANYFLCEILNDCTSTELTERLLDFNILIKDLKGKEPFSDKHIRIAVRDESDNEDLVKAVISCLY